MRCILLPLLLLQALAGAGQALLQPLTSLPSRINAASPHFAQAATFSANPASLATLSRPSVALQGERRFGQETLGSYNLDAALPLASGVLGLSAAVGGATHWQETALGLAYGRRLGQRAWTGLHFRYVNVGSRALGRAATLSADAGLLLELAPGVHTGIFTHNPGRPRLGKSGDRLPALYGMSVAWAAPGQWLLAATLRQQEGSRPAVQAGAEYLLTARLRMQAGIDTGTPGFYLGAAAETGGLRVQVCLMVHRQLGGTPGLLLLFPDPAKSAL